MVISENGSERCVIHPTEFNYTVLITGSHVSLKGFTVSGNGSCGIVVDNASSVRITSNVVDKFIGGLIIKGSRVVELVSNSIRENLAGLSINDSSRVTIQDNEISQNLIGLILVNSSNVRITQNDIIENPIANLILNSSNNISIIDNMLTKSLVGKFQ